MNRIEKNIADIPPEMPPAEWRDELLTKALDSQRTRKQSITFSKILTGVLAASWALIFALHITTPADPGGTDLAERYGVSPQQLPFLAQRFFSFNLPDPS